MIVEHAILNVKAGQSKTFEAALHEAMPLIAVTPGFIDIEVRPSVETAGRYLLLVRWVNLEAHTQGFRGSDRYEKWRALLHHFYEPFPDVEHYGRAVLRAG